MDGMETAILVGGAALAGYFIFGPGAGAAASSAPVQTTGSGSSLPPSAPIINAAAPPSASTTALPITPTVTPTLTPDHIVAGPIVMLANSSPALTVAPASNPAFPLTTAALTAAPPGAYNATAMAQYQALMQNYVSMAGNGDSFGSSFLSSFGPVAPGADPLTALGEYDKTFAGAVASYVSQYQACVAGGGAWDGNGNCSGGKGIGLGDTSITINPPATTGFGLFPVLALGVVLFLVMNK
jgi:hypothetical protein